MVVPAAFFTTTEAPDTGAAKTEPLIAVVAGAGGASFDELPQPTSNIINPRLSTPPIVNLVVNIV
jgi:hypothetical protein